MKQEQDDTDLVVLEKEARASSEFVGLERNLFRTPGSLSW